MLAEDIDDAAGILGSAAGSVVAGIGSVNIPVPEIPDISIAVGGGHDHGHRQLLDLTSEDVTKDEFLKRLWFRISGSYSIPQTILGRSKIFDTSENGLKLFTEIGKIFSQNRNK